MKIELSLKIDGEEKKLEFGTDKKDEAAEVEDAEELQLTQEEADRYEAASDLADCCEYLTEPELISLKLLVQKCQARRERGQ